MRFHAFLDVWMWRFKVGSGLDADQMMDMLPSPSHWACEPVSAEKLARRQSSVAIQLCSRRHVTEMSQCVRPYCR
jgi:hypothetical protein